MPKLLVRKGMSTPWGKAETARLIADGVGFVSTSTHGGFKVSAKLNAIIPPYMRSKSGWYEEDCAWSIPFVVLEDHLKRGGDAWPVSVITDGAHIAAFKQWFPKAYEEYFMVRGAKRT